MSVDPPKARPSSGGGHDLGYPDGAEGTMRRLDPYEHRPAMGARRTAAMQVRSERFTDVSGQRETFGTIRFAMHDDLTGSPIDIIERKRGNFASPQAETDQHGQDREVAAAVPSAAVAGRQKTPNLVRIQSPGQSGQSPGGDRWHCRCQRPLDCALDVKKAEE